MKVVQASAIFCIAFQLGCGMLTDPAVRLANCLEEGVKKTQDGATSIQLNCDLKLSGDYVVVLHPAGEKTDEELAAGGVPPAAIPEVRALRIGDHPSIYVISSGKQTPNSRTTYQNNFVRIDHVMAAVKASQPVSVEIGGPAGARVVQAIR